jgi:hypothetical protein
MEILEAVAVEAIDRILNAALLDKGVYIVDHAMTEISKKHNMWCDAYDIYTLSPDKELVFTLHSFSIDKSIRKMYAMIYKKISMIDINAQATQRSMLDKIAELQRISESSYDQMLGDLDRYIALL